MSYEDKDERTKVQSQCVRKLMVFETSRVPKWSVFGRAAGTTIEDVV